MRLILVVAAPLLLARSAGAVCPTPHGGFADSCNQCAITEKDCVLECKCSDGLGRRVQAACDLNDCAAVEGGGLLVDIANVGGAMHCAGVPCTHPPYAPGPIAEKCPAPIGTYLDACKCDPVNEDTCIMHCVCDDEYGESKQTGCNLTFCQQYDINTAIAEIDGNLECSGLLCPYPGFDPDGAHIHKRGMYSAAQIFGIVVGVFVGACVCLVAVAGAALATVWALVPTKKLFMARVWARRVLCCRKADAPSPRKMQRLGGTGEGSDDSDDENIVLLFDKSGAFGKSMADFDTGNADDVSSGSARLGFKELKAFVTKMEAKMDKRWHNGGGEVGSPQSSPKRFSPRQQHVLEVADG